MTSMSFAVQRLRTRRWIGLGIAAGGAIVLLGQGLAEFNLSPHVRQAFAAGGLGALATALGALPALAAQRLDDRARERLLGVGGGVMLAAALISLALPALAASRAQGATPTAALAVLVAGAALGALALARLDRALPHVHALARAIPKQTLLFVMAIALHNVPEGLALGVAYGGGGADDGSLALAIALQDVPEGLIVAFALLGAGLSAPLAVGLAATTGLAEPLFALVGAAAVNGSQSVLPWGLAFAAGAMLFAVGHEIVPRTLAHGQRARGMVSLATGFAIFGTVQWALA